MSEAFNPQEECYGNERLLADAGAFAGQSAPAITAGLLQKVRAFAGSAPQSDDIAILTLKVNGRGGLFGKGGPRMTLELHATPEEVMRAVEALQEFGRRRGRSPREDLFGLALALEECGSNIVNHALQRDAQQTFRVTIEHTGERDRHRAARSRSGVRSRPQAPEREPEADDDDRPPGGWGIQLVRRYMDEIRYAREGGENVLRLTKRLGEATAQN